MSLSDYGLRADPGPAVGRLLDAWGRTPLVLGMGEPTHGVERFLLLRNEVFAHLVEHRGFRTFALETDCLAAAAVDDHVSGRTRELDFDTALTHGFGAFPGNRALVAWIREYNEGREPGERVRFHGVDSPLEISGAASPRAALTTAAEYLREHLGRAPLDGLADIEDAAWENPAAMMDPSASVGGSDRARALRVAADDMMAVFEAEAPGLRRADSDEGYERALLFARTGRGLLRYHAAMASDAPDRVARMLAQRDAMMADHLLAIARSGAPAFVSAHNTHLQRSRSTVNFGGTDEHWWSAGTVAASVLGDGYAVIGTDSDTVATGGPSLQAALGQATRDRALFPVERLADLSGLGPAVSADYRYIPLSGLDGVDAVAFVRGVGLDELPKTY
ncbi:erythromycin esterase-like protein [Nocardiopsis sp. Huas11]|uniref:erythromycin esterase family protein n=1 Tax=Nocardiopsis sp. Huas11 TaxID=2183912 RepID=UPI000EB50BA0|nr:erythromycin esterase family protein [Nocardiopsis sp. Huas11]RKS09633.1 erythromycin esterase-like protein [Nocardiopsis sp. Huas11]